MFLHFFMYVVVGAYTCHNNQCGSQRRTCRSFVSSFHQWDLEIKLMLLGLEARTSALQAISQDPGKIF